MGLAESRYEQTMIQLLLDYTLAEVELVDPALVLFTEHAQLIGSQSVSDLALHRTYEVALEARPFSASDRVNEGVLL